MNEFLYITDGVLLEYGESLFLKNHEQTILQIKIRCERAYILNTPNHRERKFEKLQEICAKFQRKFHSQKKPNPLSFLKMEKILPLLYFYQKIRKKKMTDIEIAAISVGLTELGKRLGIPRKISPLVAILLAIVFCVFDTWEKGDGNYPRSIIRGILIGVTSTGLYAATQNVIQKKEDSFVKKESSSKNKK